MVRGSMRINNVLLDLDGTLADTAPDLANALNRLLQETGHAPLPNDRIRPMVSHGAIHMIKHAFSLDINAPAFDSLRDRFLDYYLENIAVHTRLFAGMHELLGWLEDRGIAWGIVTNKTERLTRPLLEALQLQQRASCVVCGDTVEYSKPHPAPMLHACSLTGHDPDRTLYIGDAQKDVEAGKAANMCTLIALYGYIDSTESPETWGADGLITEPLQARDWLTPVS